MSAWIHTNTHLVSANAEYEKYKIAVHSFFKDQVKDSESKRGKCFEDRRCAIKQVL